VAVRLLRDREVSRDSLVDGLEWLEKEVTSSDVGMVFLAGHGWNDNHETYWFLPADTTQGDVRKKGVAQEEIRRTLRRLKGKAILFLDTCHAAQAGLDAFINSLVAKENGIIVFASSTGTEVSLEDAKWQNGAFTKAVLEGLAE